MLSAQTRKDGNDEKRRPPGVCRLALTSLEAAMGLVDDVDPALAAHDAVVAMAAAQGFQRITNFHDDLVWVVAGFIRAASHSVNA